MVRRKQTCVCCLSGKTIVPAPFKVFSQAGLSSFEEELSGGAVVNCDDTVLISCTFLRQHVLKHLWEEKMTGSTPYFVRYILQTN